MSAVTQLGAQPSEAVQTSWKDYAVRFLFGGVITAIVGVLGKAFGPAVAGLFLAFPAILPASVTLVSRRNGKEQAGIDALGAAIGSVGLVAFAAIVWWLASQRAAWLVLLIASVCWFVVSGAVWLAIQQVREDEEPG